MVLIIIGTAFGINKVQQIKEKERQEQIKQLIRQSEEDYKKFDFENVFKCYSQLDGLNYNTKELRIIAEYDQSVIETTKIFYQTLVDVDSKLFNRDYISLRALVNTLKQPMKDFDELEINTESSLGQYINNIRTHNMYIGLQSEFVNNDQYDLDYGLTTNGFATCISIYTEQLIKEPFPYEGEK